MNITVDNQEFEKSSEFYPCEKGLWYRNQWYTPVPKFKEGDWVTFYSEISNEQIVDRLKEWTQYSYCRLEDGTEPFKHIIVKATHNQIFNYLRQVAVEKGLVKGVKVYKDWDGGSFVTIVQEDNTYYAETDEFAKSGIILYRKGKWVEKVQPLFKTEDGVDIYEKDMGIWVCPNNTLHGETKIVKEHTQSINRGYKLFSTKEKAQEYINKHKPKLTFGGYEVKCDLFNGTRVKVVCKGEVGYHTEIEEILKNYFRPCKFGNREVKSFTWSNGFTRNKIEVIRFENDLYAIDKIEIGCITGTYKELVDIYNHCLNLLK
jgi:hypothetical protein